MAGLPWFELDVDFHDDPKIKDLVARLRQPLADSYVSRLYAYCYKHAVDRFPAASASNTLEDVARWKGRRGVLFDALHAVGVLEREGGSVVVHGVRDRLAPHLAKREADRIRIAEKREKAALSLEGLANVAATSPRRSANVAGNRDIDRYKDKEQEAAAGDDGLIAAFREELGTRLARPPSWFRLAAADKVSETREFLSTELRRLGVARAADVAAERARREGSVKQWLRWYLGGLQDAGKTIGSARSPQPVSSDFQTKTKAELDAEAKALGFHVG